MGLIIQAICKCGFKQDKMRVDVGAFPIGYCFKCKGRFPISVEDYNSLYSGDKNIECPDCGNQNLSLSYCLGPSLCQKCKKMLILNFKDENAWCSDCKESIIFYNDPSLQKPTEEKGETISWDWYYNENKEMVYNFILPYADYKCPSCEKMTLRFNNIGNWD